jgi:anti-sigma regulatory factor (Ser/Thr protein kinase)/CheY-like chemotaxis protein
VDATGEQCEFRLVDDAHSTVPNRNDPHRNRTAPRPQDARRRLASRPMAVPLGRRRPRIVVGDHDLSRRDAAIGALSQFDSLDVCAAVTSPAEVIATVGSVRPDGVLLITDMPDLAQLSAMAALRSIHPELPVTLMVGVAENSFESADASTLLADLQALVDPLAKPPYQRVGAMLVPAELTSARAARRFAVATLSSWGLDALCTGVELVVSELVTNAVVHAASPAQVTLGQLDQGSVRVEVKDWGLGDLLPRRGGAQDPSGRGLRLVDGLTGRWGSSSHLGERSVWCDLRVD